MRDHFVGVGNMVAGLFCVSGGGQRNTKFAEREHIMSEVLMQTYLIALPIILTSILGYVVWLLKEQKKDRDANSKGTMLLLRVQLIEYHDKYVALGEIPSYAYDNFVEMYEAYHKLGGNGMVTKMYNEIQSLHLRNGNGGNRNE